ncbi:MAG: iron ABC transporter permease [Pseudomonadota bacterium]
MYVRSLVEKTGFIVSFERQVAAGDRSVLAACVVALLFGLLVLMVIAGLTIGPSGSSLSGVFRYIGALLFGAEIAERERLIIESIRLPRVVLGILVGASLAVSGAVMQGLFRNPLADPGIVGVSAGAGLGAIVVIVLGETVVLGAIVAALGIFAIPVAAFFGALAITLILYRLSTIGGETSVATLLLGGIAIAAFAGALTGILVYLADDVQLRELTFWGLGSLSGATWSKCASAAPIIVFALLFTPLLAKGLNALAMGETVAHHLGIPVQRFKNVAIFAVAGATGAAVAVSGGIGFVGIVVPHLLRLAIGPDNRFLLPASALLGASLLLVCDAICRTIVAPAELPIGIITAFIGAPFFLWLLMGRRGILGG